MRARTITRRRRTETPAGAAEPATALLSVVVRRSAPPAPRPAGRGRCSGGLTVAAVVALALALAYGTRVALSLTAVVGQRGELLVSIQPGPLAAGGAAVGLVLALGARCRPHQPRRRRRSSR